MVGASLDGRTADIVEVEWDALGKKIEKPAENYVGTVHRLYLEIWDFVVGSLSLGD